jgi:hypothetical protein
VGSYQRVDVPLDICVFELLALFGVVVTAVERVYGYAWTVNVHFGAQFMQIK